MTALYLCRWILLGPPPPPSTLAALPLNLLFLLPRTPLLPSLLDVALGSTSAPRSVNPVPPGPQVPPPPVTTLSPSGTRYIFYLLFHVCLPRKNVGFVHCCTPGAWESSWHVIYGTGAQYLFTE